MIVREPGVEGDLLLLQWWSILVEDGELLDVFSEIAETPSGFLGVFTNPNIAFFYDIDEKGITKAIWFEPFMGTNVSMGMWCRKDWRHGRWWGDLIDVLGKMFEHTPMVMFITKRPHVVESALRVGFTSMGKMPYAYRGEDGYVAYLTREEYEKKHGKYSR